MGSVTPTKELQKEKVKKHFDVEDKEGSLWYIIDYDWFMKWKKYVNFDDHEKSDSQEEVIPGVIDNKCMMDSGGTLRERLVLRQDFDVIPSDTWSYLIEIYGLLPKEHPEYFQRKMVKLPTGDFRVEVYPLKLILCKTKYATDKCDKYFSPYETVGYLKKTMLHQFKLSENEKYNLYFKDDLEWKLISVNENDYIDKLDLKHCQEVAIELLSQNGISNTMSTRQSYNQDSRRGTEGLCGLSNLGNTCFMNSAIQCMSNVPQLTNYFRQKTWKNELNRHNPLGRKGEIAENFASLIEQMWSGVCSSTSPRDLKYSIGMFAPQFYGYAQHDSQELLVFLLDGLHEDLNRIKKKPYVEFEDSDDRPDEEVAKEAWDNHLKRNDSIIVDLFHGQLKSTVTCPECKFISVTFDPFSSLSLPLPNECVYFQVIHYVSRNARGQIVKLKVRLVRGAVARTLLQAVKESQSLPEKHSLRVAEFSENKLKNILREDDALSKLENRQYFVYDLPVDDDQAIIQVNISNKDRGVVLPLLVAVPKSGFTHADLSSVLLPLIDKEDDVTQVNGNSNSEDAKSPMSCQDTDQGDSRRAEGLSLTITKSYALSNTVIKPTNDKKHTLGSTEYIQAVWKTPITVHDDSSCRMSEKNSVHLDECFRLFTTQERLGTHDMWFCRKCKKHITGLKKFDLWTIPEVLIVHLKRFYFFTYRREKINSRITFPVNGLDLSQFVQHTAPEDCIYDLVSVSNHMGGMGGGHYTAFAKNAITNKWYSFNDSYVQSVNESDIITSNAYVLVYTRRKRFESMDTS